MPKTRIMTYAIIVFLLLPSITFAETPKIKKHRVIKGDTLWGITKKDLKDPFLWPKVWKANPRIANPRWIYPNQIIKIPLYLLQKEKLAEEAAPKPVAASQEPVKKEEAASAPQEPAKEEVKKEVVQIIKHPLIDKNVLTASGYIADTIPRAGQIIGSSSGQTIFGNGDIVYITVDRPAQVGDKFYVIKVSEEVDHPVTGDEIGYVITIGGIAEIVKIKNGETMAKITKCFRDIDKGDRLDSYYEIETPMTTGNFRNPNISGMIIATSNQMVLQSMLDIVYIDKGCKNGIEAGDMFRTFAVGAQTVPNGIIQVINCRDNTATAIVKYSSMPVSPENIFAELVKPIL
jgi:hypothetical protein